MPSIDQPSSSSVDQQLEHEPQHQQHPSHPPMEQIQQFGQQRCLEGVQGQDAPMPSIDQQRYNNLSNSLLELCNDCDINIRTSYNNVLDNVGRRTSEHDQELRAEAHGLDQHIANLNNRFMSLTGMFTAFQQDPTNNVFQQDSVSK